MRRSVSGSAAAQNALLGGIKGTSYQLMSVPINHS